MGLSMNEFRYSGNDEFDLNFAQGYASREDISCRTIKDGAIIDLDFDWLTSSKVRLQSGHGLARDDKIQFLRTVSKTQLPVDLSRPGKATRENLALLSQHVMYVMHEALDGRIAKLVFDELALSYGAQDIESSINALTLGVNLKRDVVLRTGLSQKDETLGYTSGGTFCNPEDVVIFVETPPNKTVELLLYNGDQVQFSATINSNGQVVDRSTNEINLVEGRFKVRVSGDIYNSGADIVMVLPCISASYADLDYDIEDYIELFETARDETNG